MRVVFLGLTFCLVMGLGCGPSRQEFEDLKKQLATVENEVARKETEVKRLRKENTKLRRQAEAVPDVIEKVKIKKVKEKVYFTILNDVLFEKGKSVLQPTGRLALNLVLARIQSEYPDRDVVVEGHTDDQPYRQPDVFSNWELSAQRALAVLRHLEEKGIEPERLSVAAYSQYHPVAENSSEEGRRQNRRAVVVVQPPRESIEKRSAEEPPESQTDRKES